MSFINVWDLTRNTLRQIWNLKLLSFILKYFTYSTETEVIYKSTLLYPEILSYFAHLLIANILKTHQFSSVAQSCLTLWPHELQHARPPCPSLTPRVYPNSCPMSQWCHPAISSFVIPFSSCPQSLPTSGSFQWVSSSQVAKVLEFQL